ncbi:MAG: NADH-quinone oxidoreductase subunit NuoF [Hespellia sp.]|nr:NADH-quinone oxidoreductase subunit NuoF [Hespellia sp.]
MKSLEELQVIREKMHDRVAIRRENPELLHQGEDSEFPYRLHVLVCGGTGCTSSGSQEIRETLEKEIKAQGLETQVCVIKTGCFGLCALGPIMIVYPEGAFYSMIKVEDIPEIVSEHFVKGNVVRRLLYDETTKTEKILPMDETNFYKKQHRIALRNCGVINPENIEEYIGTGGYQALGKALTDMKPEDVIQTLLDSGLRGRGGAGFPTGLKWKFAAGNDADQKYVCCNADEGDPGAFMDRSVLEGDPHVVLEAMAIAGFAIGATQGYIYVRAEYPIAVERLEIAISQAREYGMLGKDIFGTGFDFDIDLRLGAGAFVCGEETALMTSIEGNRGEPRPRPPFPAVKGLFQKPTILNNVETYANIPQIIVNGPEWFAAMGTEKSKGTKVFALGGKINNTGLVEIPMGTTLREIVEEIGGGIPNGKKFKAAQTGGPSGGCIPASQMDVPIDYDNLIAIGSMMGSGGLIVMDEDNCMVDIAKFFLEFTVDESCGKCSPCRIGTRRMLEILEKITHGQGEMEDLEKLEELAEHLKHNSLCALGQTAPNPVISTMKYFRDEYIAHIVDKKCPAGVCKALLQYKIDADKCKGCTLCARNCPADAITGTVKEPHVIDSAKCIKCGACMEKCRFGAIYKE